MAFFIRVFASLFLFFSQSVFADGQVDNVYYYRAEVCSLSYQSFCKSDVYPQSSANEVITPLGCGFYGYSDPQAHYQTQYRQGWTSPPEGAMGVGNAGLAQTRHKICNVGEKLELDGCTATCVADPCAAKKDAKFTAYVTCGTASCDSPAIIAGGAGGLYCLDSSTNSGKHFKFSYEGYAGSAVKDGCIGSIDPEFVQPSLPAAKARTSAVGSSSSAAYCEGSYIYTGTSASPDDPPSDLASITGVGVLASTENGSCPANYVHGQSGANGQWVCVPEGFGGDGGSNCPSGQIKNNSGVCVPFADAGTGSNGCPTGQTKNASGVCAASGTGSGTDCPTGQVKNSSGVCAASGTGSGSGCPTGQSKNSAGVCMSAGTGSSVGCPPNYYKSNDTCVIGGAGTGGGAGEGDGTGTESKDCAVEPFCTGDPVNCSILRQSWFNNCQLLAKVSGDDEAAVNSSLSNTEGQIDGIKSTLQNSLTSALSTLPTNVPLSSSCVADSSFKIGLVSVPIPLSKLCPYFQTLRSMLLLVSYLFAARIIFGSINGGGVRV